MPSVSVILNLSPQALSAGQLAGQAEIVATGERRVVASAGELVNFLQHQTVRSPEEAGFDGDA